MEGLSVLAISVQVVFIFLGAVSLYDYLRTRDQPRLLVALVFGSLAAFLLVADFVNAAGIESVWVGVLGLFVLVLHPYLLLQLVDHFRLVPPRAQLLARAGLVLCGLGLLLFGVLSSLGVDAQAMMPLPALVVFLLIGYFVVVEACAAVLLFGAARAASGVSRRRLWLASAGSGLLALAIGLLASPAVLPSASDFVALPLLLAAVLSGVCSYLGFATPRWLRRTWQCGELFAFLHNIGERPVDERAGRSLEELCAAGLRVSGGTAAVVALVPELAAENLAVAENHAAGARAEPPPPGGVTLWLRPDSGLPGLTGWLALNGGALARAWESRAPAIATQREDFGFDAARLSAVPEASLVMLALPLQSRGRVWGMLMLFRRRHSPFVHDDVELLQILTEETAMALDYAALIRELQERSTQLEATNNELEAFAYSVSHDLRAPLRAIDGYSLAVLEDFAAVLPEEGQHYLNRTRAAAQRMAALIDDLLNLSRVNRSEMRREMVDLTALANALARDLRQSEPNRDVTFVIADGLRARGDSRLLRVALDNLLANAWKFTSKCEHARIEFGVQLRDGVPVYFVRDNGAGFDMAYADKLFGVFQRLHSTSDYPGTGVGLATVQRIVHRHAGRVWAESAPGQGAAFYFTLGAAPGANGSEYARQSHPAD